MEKQKDVLRYVLLGAIVVVLISILMVLRGGPTGYAVFGDDDQTGFDLGSYSNVEWNGSAIVLSEDNLTGTYTSQIFDATNDAVWNNLSWVSNEPGIEFLFVVDGVADVWKSNGGVSWSLVNDDYTGADGNGATYLISNSSGGLFSVYNQDLFQSTDSGITWIKVNDDINGAASNSALVMTIDSNNYIYIIDGSDGVLKSTDSGVTFSEINESFGAGPNAGAMIADSNNNLFIVDNTADVWKSTDSGISWALIKDDYNDGIGNDVNDMFVNSSDDLFILHNQDLWQSTDSGVNWVLVNDDYNEGGDTNTGLVIYIDSNDDIYIADGGEDIYKSTDSGVSFTRIVENLNGVSGNVLGLTSIDESTSLIYSVRSCDDDVCSGEGWTVVSDPLSLGLDDNMYFQYKIDFTSPDSSVSSSLISMDVDYDLVNSAPVISIVAPSEGDSYGYNESLALDFTVSDINDNIDSCWYNLDDGVNITLASCANITFDIAEGSHDLNIYANDSLGLSASDSASFSVAVGAPTIVLDYPINVYFDNGANIEFNYTPTDVDLDSCWLLGDFTGVYSINQTDVGVSSGVVNMFSLSLSDGTYLWNVGCNDSVGNSAINGNKSFYVDTINPLVSLSEPNGAKTSRASISLDFSVSDASPLICYYNITTSVGTEIVNDVEIVNCTDTSFDVSADGDYIIYLWAVDGAGNSNNTNSSFSIDTSSVVVPPVDGGSSGGGGGSAIILNQTGKLKVSLIGDIIAHAGDQKSLLLDVKNTGRVFLNKCRLLATGDISSWIYSDMVDGIAPGENFDFTLNINVPEELNPGDYFGELEIRCDEGNDVQEMIISIPGLSAINLNEIIQEGNFLKINYIFDNSNFIGDSVLLDVWIVDEAGNEINRVQDGFEINKEGTIERNVEIGIGDLSGIYYVYFALSEDLDEFVRQSVVLGKSPSTGMAIFGETQGKIISYISFVIIIFAGVIFTVIRHKKHKVRKGKKHKNNWLLRKRTA